MADDDLKMELVEWEDRPHCVYLNGYRVAGGKPWAGGKTIRTWKVSRRDLIEAMKRFRAENTATNRRKVG